MRVRIKDNKRVYITSTGSTSGITCQVSQSSKDKHTLLWESIQRECKRTTLQHEKV